MCDCTRETIRRWLHRHEIPVRDSSGASEVEWENAPEVRHEQAREHYRNLTPPHVENGEHSPETIQKMSEVKRGEQNPRWRGGHTVDRGENWQEQRELALERDFYQCRCCRMTRSEHRDRFNRDLTVHHRTPFRHFEGYEKANRLRNLLTLCVRCHSYLEPTVQ